MNTLCPVLESILKCKAIEAQLDQLQGHFLREDITQEYSHSIWLRMKDLKEEKDRLIEEYEVLQNRRNIRLVT